MIGTRALLFEAPGAFDLAQQRRIWAMVEEAAGWNGVAEAEPGVTNLTLTFRQPPEDIGRLEQRLLDAWERLPERQVEGRLFDIPAVYGGALGEDLAHVCAHSGLTREEVIRLHAAGDYTVLAIGSLPGFGYLHGLDPRLFTPRKAVPSMWMEAGTVIIGGAQAGISALAGPNGWHSIGYTDIRMFDPLAEPPSLFAIGDRLRFRAERVER